MVNGQRLMINGFLQNFRAAKIKILTINR